MGDGMLAGELVQVEVPTMRWIGYEGWDIDMSDQKSTEKSAAEKGTTGKKTGRVKRSRLGRGLSALVEVPTAEPVVVELPTRSDNSSGGSFPQPVQQDTPLSGGQVHSGGDALVRDRVRGETSNPRVAGEIRLDTSGTGGGAEGAAGERVVLLSVGVIRVNRDQPRRVFDEDRLNDLAGSIAVHGVMQPIVVRAVDDGGRLDSGGSSDGVGYELIAGERRWRASRIAGIETIPAIVREVDDETSAQLALIENVQREDLNVMELAEGYRVLSDRYGMTQEQISGTVGVSRSLVANTVRLLDLPNEVRGLIVEGKLSSGHGKVLLSLGAPEKQRKFAARCLKEGWNIRLLQKACDDDADGVANPVQGESSDSSTRLHSGANSEDDRALSVLRDLERQVGEELGTRVKIRTDKSRTRGRVVIEFFDLDQFDGLLGRLGVTTRG